MFATSAAKDYGLAFRRGTLRGQDARPVETRPARPPVNSNNDRNESETSRETWSSVTQTPPRSDEQRDLKHRRKLWYPLVV